MEVFRDLNVKASAEQMAALVAEMEQSLPSGWTRDRAAEARAESSALGAGRVYCFGCQAEGKRAAALVILVQKDSETFSVSNILSLSKYRLATAEYNDVLEEFYEHLLRPCAERAGLVAVLSGAAVGLDRWLSATTAEKLKTFSANANKGGGSSHPNDWERWNDFVLAAHQEGSGLDASTLKRWLVEVEGWSPEAADQLAVGYQYGRELLAFAEGHRRSA